jgi:hypothetical protein
MRGRFFLLLALVTAGFLPAGARAEDPVAVSCDGFVIGYQGPAKQRGCVIVNVEEGTQTYKSSQLTVIDHAFFILMYYIESGFKTYMPLHTLQEMTEDSKVFGATGDWQPQRSILGFDVAVFNGALKGREIPSVCAIFSRYSGDPGNGVDYTLGPGFKNHVVGYYCAVTASLTPEQQGEGFYAVVQNVIGQLTVPPVDQ